MAVDRSRAHPGEDAVLKRVGVGGSGEGSDCQHQPRKLHDLGSYFPSISPEIAAIGGRRQWATSLAGYGARELTPATWIVFLGLMHLVCIDDSKDEQSCCFAAVILPAIRWADALDHLIAFRRRIKDSHGIYVGIEMHATDWLGGRGNIAPRTVLRQDRAHLFREYLRHVALLPECAVITAHGRRRQETQLFERMCNRIQRNMIARNSYAMLISDEGKNFDGLVRRMRRHNPIPGHFGGVLNKPLDRIVEDLVYRKSDRSLFIQAADFCAFSLLRMETPTPKIERMGLADAFLELDHVLVKKAYAADPRRLGIIRI